MSLADLIRKRSTLPVATAIPAIPATNQAEIVGTVAKIATIAVAKPYPESDEVGDWRELDALILHYAQLVDMPVERLDRLLEARRRMAPIRVQADIDQFKEWIDALEANQ